MNFQLSDFFIINKIGEGAHGKIYQAQHLPTKQIVSLKEIDLINPIDEETQKKRKRQSKELDREITIMKDIYEMQDFHPNIMSYYGGFQLGDKVYLVLEYIKGENLLNFARRYKTLNQKIDENLIIIILKGIINGLIYLFEKKILHRDITLDNIMIEDNQAIYNVKITDFGISAYYKNYDQQNNQNQVNNNSNNGAIATVIARREYISPELFSALNLKQEKTKYNFKVDIYSLGVTMFYLMTFQFPYEIIEEKGKKERIRTNAFIDPNKYNQQLINIIMSMLEENAYKRPSCYDIFKELSDLIGNNNMKINYQIKMNDINLKANYIIKKSVFFSAIYSLYNISAIKSHFESKTVIDAVENFKQKSPELAIVIESFIEVIKELKNKEVKSKMEGIIDFLEKSSKKIIIFKEYNKITPQLVIENLFDYFYCNISNIFKFYNNNMAFKIAENIKKNKDISPIIKQKVDEFKNNYSNIFADIFYFITLTKKMCPECNFLIEEEANIEYEIELEVPGNIKQLIEDFEIERYYSNLGKNGKVCKKCGIMPINLTLKKSIFSAPNVLIFHLLNDNIEIDENIEINESINPNKLIGYTLSSVIVKEYFNNNYKYNVAIFQNNIDSWIYYFDEDSTVLSFKELLAKGTICTAFYQKDE